MSSAALERPFFAIADLAERWGVSPFTIRRLIDSEQLRSVTIGARRFIPTVEVERAELEGAGVPRKRKAEK